VSDKAVPRVEVSVGDVHGSQLVIGDHNTIQTPEGTEVTFLQVGERPVPKLRPLPISRRPSAAEILGREDELALIASAVAAEPVQVYAEDGAGKSCLLKFAAHRAPDAAEGVVFEAVRHRSFDEVQGALYGAFWECDIPFIPAAAQMADFLGDREALVVLDDCGLDRDEVETLLDGLPRCTIVLASETRTLWSRGTARGLGELDRVAAVGLLERQLGHTFDPEERAAAEALVARIGGHPQSLVETAALVEDGRASLRELANDPSALKRFDPAALTDSQKRILAILAALDGAPLGTEHVSALAGDPEAEKSLQELERRGWVKSGSPRYRSVRELPPEAGAPLDREIAKPLLGQLSAWCRESGACAVAEEAEAIERTLELGAEAERWEETLALSLAAERGLLVAGAWSSCRRVLQTGLRAAGAIGNRSAAAFLLHQLGSQALCLGDEAGAQASLGEALYIREELQEHEGAELTRHNLRQLGGGGGSGPNGGGGSGPWRPRAGIALAALAVVAGIVGALLLSGGTGKNTANTSPNPSTHSTTTTTHPTTTTTTETTTPPTTTTTPVTTGGGKPTIVIASPEDGATLEGDGTTTASFKCTPADGSEHTTCEGTVDGVPIETGDSLPRRTGHHTLRVTAIDDNGEGAVETAGYEVKAPAPPPHPDETPPDINIISPVGKYEQGARVVAEYECTDTESEPVTCDGDLDKGATVDTKTPGSRSFSVTAVDSAGQDETKTVEYEVISPG